MSLETSRDQDLSLENYITGSIVCPCIVVVFHSFIVSHRDVPPQCTAFARAQHKIRGTLKHLYVRACDGTKLT